MKKLLGIVVLGLLWCGNGFSNELWLSDEPQLEAQIHKCFGSIPLGFPLNDDLIVKIKLKLKPDGTVLKYKILWTDRTQAYLAKDVLMPAINSCQPFKLPFETYEIWKDMILVYDFNVLFEGGKTTKKEPKQSQLFTENNGYGTYIKTNGDKYVGELKNGLYHGQGTYTWSDGNKYVGEFKDNLFNGQGTYTWPNGRKYVGEWKDGVRHGQGTWYVDGRKYVVEYKDGKRIGCITGDCKNGYGTYIEANGDNYVGEWKDDKKHGQGTLTYANGRKYVGEWKDGYEHGQGTHTGPNGTKYVGEWKDGVRHGQGTLTFTDGNKYVGEWKDDKFHGQGTWTHVGGDKYVGEFKDGRPSGQGTYTSADGTKYVGEWEDGASGQGTITYDDGRKYVGEWKSVEYHGLGTLTCGSKKYTLKGGKIDCKPGRKIEAIWEDGSPIDILIIK